MTDDSAGMIELFADGRAIRVEAGSSVAAALLAAETFSFRRSARGSPRGPVCGMGVCFECRVTIDGIPQRRACMVVVRPGMLVSTTEDS